MNFNLASSPVAKIAGTTVLGALILLQSSCGAVKAKYGAVGRSVKQSLAVSEASNDPALAKQNKFIKSLFKKCGCKGEYGQELEDHGVYGPDAVHAEKSLVAANAELMKTLSQGGTVELDFQDKKFVLTIADLYKEGKLNDCPEEVDFETLELNKK